MVGETSDAGIEAQPGFVRLVDGGGIIIVALGHDCGQSALSQGGERLLRASRIAPKIREDKCADNPF